MKYVKILLTLFCVVLFFSIAHAAKLEVVSVTYNPAPVMPGKSFDLWVTVENPTGPTVTDATVELDFLNALGTSTFPFSLPSDETAKKSIGIIEGGKSAVAKFTVLVDALATSGNYTIKLIVDASGVTSTKHSQTIQIYTRKPQIEITDSSITEAEAGKTVETVLTLKNVGSSRALNILVGSEEDRTVTSTGVVVERDIYPLGSALKYVESLAAGQETQVVLLLGINRDAENKSYLMPLTLKWVDENRTESSATRYIGIRVFSDPEIGVTISEVEPIAFASGTSEITIDLFNVGAASALYAVAEVTTDIAEVSEKVHFIGTLDADDFDSFKTKLRFKNDLQAGEHPITVKFTYKDSENQPVTEINTLMLNVYSPGEAAAILSPPFDPIGLLIQLIILAVIIYIVYRKFFRKKKK